MKKSKYLFHFWVLNFKRDFLETWFFSMIDMTTQKVINTLDDFCVPSDFFIIFNW